MRVQDIIMQREVRWCSPRATLATAGTMMAEAGCGFLPVLENGRVMGVVTDRDICLALARLDRRPTLVDVREAMSQELHSCDVDAEVGAALDVMRARGVRRLPVLDAKGKLQGVLSLDDVTLAARAFETEGFTGPLYPDIAKTLQAICAAQAAPAEVQP